MATGLDFTTAFSAVGACINNLGPGMGDVSMHYGAINITAKWVFCFAMLLGRLEVFTLLVLLAAVMIGCLREFLLLLHQWKTHLLLL